MGKKRSKTSKKTSRRSKKRTVRVAMIGAGGMANAVHYPSLASFDDVTIAGICDIDEGRLNETADKYSIEKRYTDYRRMIDEVAPDGVYAVGPPHIMYDIWVWLLQQGLNIYTEKPMGMSFHQARMLAYLAEEHGCITQVSFQRRNSPLLVKMRKACLARGPIVHAICEFHKCNLVPYTGSSGFMIDDAIHAIDTVRWMCGGEVVDVQSRTKRACVPDINWIHADIQFDTGAIGFVQVNMSSGRRVFRVQMHAPGISTDAEVEGKAYLYKDNDYHGDVFDTKEVAGSNENYVFGGFQSKNREFIDSLKTGKTVCSSPYSDAIKTMEVADIILAQSILSGI